MFFYNTFKRRSKEKNIMSVLNPNYEIKKNFKVGKNRVNFLLPRQRVVIEFGEYDHSEKKTMELEKSGLKVFNIPHKEDIFVSLGRLLYVIRSIEENSVQNKGSTQNKNEV